MVCILTVGNVDFDLLLLMIQNRAIYYKLNRYPYLNRSILLYHEIIRLMVKPQVFFQPGLPS
jgi:hypothetical protein